MTRTFAESAGLPTGHHYFYSMTVAAQASLHMSDIATLRARAGIETGNFLPYVFGGLAVARAEKGKHVDRPIDRPLHILVDQGLNILQLAFVDRAV